MQIRAQSGRSAVRRAASAVLALAFLFSPISAGRANAAVEGVYAYVVSGGEATVTACRQSVSGALTVPAELGGVPRDAQFMGTLSNANIQPSSWDRV